MDVAPARERGPQQPIGRNNRRRPKNSNPDTKVQAGSIAGSNPEQTPTLGSQPQQSQIVQPGSKTAIKGRARNSNENTECQPTTTTTDGSSTTTTSKRRSRNRNQAKTPHQLKEQEEREILSKSCKIVVRKLPPLLNEFDFRKAIDSYSKNDKILDSYYVQGKYPKQPFKEPTYSRCHILLKDNETMLDFAEFIKKTVFMNSKFDLKETGESKNSENEVNANDNNTEVELSTERQNQEFNAVVEKSAFRKMNYPFRRERFSKLNGTIKDDPIYKAFVKYVDELAEQRKQQKQSGITGETKDKLERVESFIELGSKKLKKGRSVSPKVENEKDSKKIKQLKESARKTEETKKKKSEPTDKDKKKKRSRKKNKATTEAIPSDSTKINNDITNDNNDKKKKKKRVRKSKSKGGEDVAVLTTVSVPAAAKKAPKQQIKSTKQNDNQTSVFKAPAQQQGLDLPASNTSPAPAASKKKIVLRKKPEA